MADSLEDRLRSHAQAFDGLLSLIPAKYYYGEDTSDQWQRKKQTKEEARNAKKAKLDPDSSKTAKDLMDEQARKRKREGDDQEGAGSDSENSPLGSEKPLEGLKSTEGKPKKQKKTNGESEEAAINGDIQDEKIANAEAKKKRKIEKKTEKKEQKKQKLEKKETKVANENASKRTQKPAADEVTSNKDTSHQDKSDGEEDLAPIQGFSTENNQDDAEPASTAPSSPFPNPQALDASNPPSGSSSISSIVPPSTDQAAQKETKTDSPKPPKPSPEELKQRLQKRLDELRAARHADGLNGKPARSRQELIEARRQREEQRRAHKKELRRKAKEEEQEQRDEAIARRFSPRGSLLASPGSPAESINSLSNNFSFGRVVFADGQQTDPGMSALLEKRKQKGPQDPGTALKAAEAKKAKLENLDDEKRADIAEKDMWLNAKRRAHGERVKDDVSLLKKTLNRKANTKKKSERDWKERIENVAKGKEMRQAKRTENIQKRKEEKANKGKKGKNKARPGFEGKKK